jgi:hypothetical protein
MEALIEAGRYRPGWSAAHSVGSWRIVWRRESGSGRGAFDGGGGFEERGLSAFDDQFLEFGGDYPYPYHNIPFVKSVPFTRTHSIALGRSPRHRKSSCAQSAIIRKSTVTSADIRASSNI